MSLTSLALAGRFLVHSHGLFPVPQLISILSLLLLLVRVAVCQSQKNSSVR